MKIGSIVAEYNPFHNGHKYQIEQYKIKKNISHLVVAMSGNFVQRGGPAIFDKFSRAEMAILGGADLVIEIPAYFATQTAELYARGAVLSLNALGCLDSICFGAEEDNINNLIEVAEVIVNQKEKYENILVSLLEKKQPFPIARQNAVAEILKKENSVFLSESNNILAIEYIKELIRINSEIKPFSILRKGAAHNSTESKNGFKSATAIRNDIFEIKKELGFNNIDVDKKIVDKQMEKYSQYIPETSEKIIKRNFMQGFYPIEEKDFFDEILYSVLRNEDSLEEYFEIVEGIENSIRKNAIVSYDFESMISALTSSRYTSARIRRMIFNILLGVKKDDIIKIKNIKKAPYIRVLAFNKRGAEILKEVKNKSDVLIINSPAKVKKSNEYKNDDILRLMFDFDIRSSNIYYQKYYIKNRHILKKGEPDFIKLGYML